jgi:hypothetical protein
VTDPYRRASDDDRQRVVAELERHTAAGRLTLDEFGERVDQALAAVTHGELAGVTRDLPAEPAGPPLQHRELAVAFLLAALTLLVLGVIFAVGR